MFARILMALAQAGHDANLLMIDTTCLKVHRTAASLRARMGLKAGHRMIGRNKGGLNSKLHVVAVAKGPPIKMFLTAGQRSDYLGALALLSSMPPAQVHVADRGYDADWLRATLSDRGIAACIPARRGRRTAIQHDSDRYRQRHRIENMFARIKDWRRIARR